MFDFVRLFFPTHTETRASAVGADPKTPRYLALRGKKRSKLGIRPYIPKPELKHESAFVDAKSSIEELFTPDAPKGDVPLNVGDIGPPVGGIIRTTSDQEILVEEPDKRVTFAPEPEIKDIALPESDVGPAEDDVQVPVGSGFLRGLFSRIFAGVKDSVAVGLVQEVYAGYSGEEGSSDTKFSLSFWQACKCQIFGSHGARHRTIRRVAGVIKELRPLLDDLRFCCSERELRDVSPLGVQFIENAVRNLIRKAIEDGTVDSRRAPLLKRLLVRLAPLSVDEDDFARLVGEVVGARSASY